MAARDTGVATRNFLSGYLPSLQTVLSGVVMPRSVTPDALQRVVQPSAAARNSDTVAADGADFLRGLFSGQGSPNPAGPARTVTLPLPAATPAAPADMSRAGPSAMDRAGDGISLPHRAPPFALPPELAVMHALAQMQGGKISPNQIMQAGEFANHVARAPAKTPGAADQIMSYLAQNEQTSLAKALEKTTDPMQQQKLVEASRQRMLEVLSKKPPMFGGLDQEGN